MQTAPNQGSSPSAPRVTGTPVTQTPAPASKQLAAALRNLRRGRGLAQRDLLRPLHLGSHSAIVDFEAGRRIPPEAIVAGYEKFFDLPDGTLRKLREQALVERAAAEAPPGPGPAGRTAVAPKPPAAPRQLPATPESFIGR